MCEFKIHTMDLVSDLSLYYIWVHLGFPDIYPWIKLTSGSPTNPFSPPQNPDIIDIYEDDIINVDIGPTNNHPQGIRIMSGQ